MFKNIISGFCGLNSLPNFALKCKTGTILHSYALIFLIINSNQHETYRKASCRQAAQNKSC